MNKTERQRLLVDPGLLGFSFGVGLFALTVASILFALVKPQSGLSDSLLADKVLKLTACGLFLFFIGVLEQTQFTRLSQRRLYTWHLPAFLILQVLEAALVVFFAPTYVDIVHLAGATGVAVLALSYNRQVMALQMSDSSFSLLIVFVGSWLLIGIVHLAIVAPDSPAAWSLLLAYSLVGALLITLSLKLSRASEASSKQVNWLLLLVALLVLTEHWGVHAPMWQWVGIGLSFLLALLIIYMAYGVQRLVSWYLLMFRHGIDDSQIACYWGHPDGRVLFVNSAYRRLFALPSDAGLSGVLHPFAHHPLWPDIQKAMQNGQDWSAETMLKDGSGNMLSVKAELKPVAGIGRQWYQASLIDLQEKIELLEQRVTAEEKLERLSLNLLEKQEEERRYFAKELHDEIGQGLTLIKIQHQLPEPDEQLITHVLAELIDKVRNLSLNLRPAILDDMGLSAALDWLVGRQKRFSQLAIKANIAQDIPRFNDKVEITVFRIAQEAFTNIHKYAHAHNVEFACHYDGTQLVLVVKDDGVGFDVNAKLNHAFQSQSLGLVGIQERAYLIHGRVKIEASPEQGTWIELVIPLAESKENEDVAIGA